MLQDIVPSLEKMHFPVEWRSLFAAAGIPQEALDDIESTRTLVDIITNSLDQISENSRMTEVDSGRGVSVSPPHNNHALQPEASGIYRPSEQDVQDNDRSHPKTSARSTYTGPMPGTFYTDSIEAVSLANKMQEHFQGVPPPPPLPPPPMPLLPAIHNPAPPEQAAFMDEIKSGLKNVRLKSIPERSETRLSEAQNSSRLSEGQGPAVFTVQADHLSEQKQKLKHVQHTTAPKSQSSDFYIAPSELLSQKAMLKHVDRAEPSKLTDLSGISENKLTSLADILRKVSLIKVVLTMY